MRMKKLVCWLLVFVLTSGFIVPMHANEEEVSRLEMFDEMITTFGERFHYSDYLQHHSNAARPTLAQDIVIDATDYITAEGMEVQYFNDFEEMPGVSVWTDEQGLIEWEFNVPSAGLYNISVTHFNALGNNSDIQRAVFINGEIPFFESNPLEFRRIWENRKIWNEDRTSYIEIQRDSLGNDMRPTQVEKFMWQETTLRDAMGTYNEYFTFYLNEGRNTIGLFSLREPMIIRSIRIHQAPVARPYSEVAAQRANLNTPNITAIRIEGEDAVRKSAAMLAPGANTGGPGVLPYDAKYIRVNNIGGGSWSAPGSWIEWEFEVPEAGLYSIALNVLQNYQRGTNSFRRITVNGEIPFSEMEAVPFEFQSNWRVERLGDENGAFLFELNAGTNTIRMETVLGDYAWYLREIQDISLHLNDLYRQIVMLTGLKPDRFRDYDLSGRLPHLKEELTQCRDRLIKAHGELIAMAPGRGGRDAVLNSTAQLLKRMIDDIENIPRRVQDFNINISSLGSWLMMVREQSLAVDAIYILPHDAPTPTNAYSWWRQLWHEILSLFWSFIIDYNAIPSAFDGEVSRSVEVWIGTGRDQANLIKSLVDETFTQQTGIGVSIKLTDPNTLLPATVAGQGPDVALSVWNALPMDYGLRGAVADISQMPGFEETAARFHPAAMTPYMFDNRVFALPETLTFNMLFYRKDILHEIGLEPPDTWDEVRSAIAHLSRFHMEFGLPISIPADGQVPIDLSDTTFSMFLFQNGGTLYNEDNTASALDSEVSLNAFRDFTRFFTDYNLPRVYDFVNRFRMGEMPLAIADYTSFNVLQVFAPEIRGMWGFRPVPATVRADGTIDRSVPGGGLAVVMMESAEDKDAAWQFMQWWTSADTQTMFGQRMEALMGPAARHPTANMESFERMPWAVADAQQLRAQMEWVQGLPQIPGAYFTPRQIRNAFFITVELDEIGAREALTDYTRFINDEIRTKRREFGFD